MRKHFCLWYGEILTPRNLTLLLKLPYELERLYVLLKVQRESLVCGITGVSHGKNCQIF